jgi:hypothetical protein
MKSKKERAGDKNYARIPVFHIMSPPKTPISSKLRKDAQAKALAAERVAERCETKAVD